MGIQQSQVILSSPQAWQEQKQYQLKNKKKNMNARQKRRQQFYEIQSCNYPHPYMKANADKHNKNKREFPTTEQQNEQFQCKRVHEDYKSFKLCSDCQRQPQHIKRNKRLVYEKAIEKQSEQSNYSSRSDRLKYVERQANTYGPQNPLFFNGFTLPLDRYNRQKPTFSQFSTEFTKPADEPFFDNDGQQMEQSIFQSQYPNDLKRYPRRIDNEGFQQNLPL